MIPPKHPDDRVALGEPVAGDVHADGQCIAETESRQGQSRGARAALEATTQADSAVASPTVKWAIFRESLIRSRTEPYFPPPSLRVAAFRRGAPSPFVENGRTSETGPNES